ncbi:MAG: CPXCG motif-containing cysteine-rich protein [Gammaproteobacteria bacterium]
MLIPYNVDCPYCGEIFETSVDTSAGDQEYIEDCYVCCRPINFRITTDYDGNLLNVQTNSDD